MDEEEIVDVLDDSMKAVGSKKRKYVHRDGDWQGLSTVELCDNKRGRDFYCSSSVDRRK